jgi:hypothetical protein
VKITIKGVMMALAVTCALGLGNPPALALTGELAPAFTLPTLAGKTMHSPALKDKRAELMVFWASW